MLVMYILTVSKQADRIVMPGNASIPRCIWSSVNIKIEDIPIEPYDEKLEITKPSKTLKPKE